ncbi:hypothetical protein [Roseimaritima ulvae]|uniref:Uncharacterized protein n=1 Tax=Roseimaritima ulvae TaxID=980254 RepID=A0A5B9R2G0_9BACT|nr:hypothetical protein [Roseimaritima ulvae]QEG40493.1 hypothetical protein UC8_25050 [Roseimaritima ulvae]
MKTLCTAALLTLLATGSLSATTTFDGRHDTSLIDVTVVYFVPSDRAALPDWRERLDYFSRRIERFHQREFGSQSTMKATVHAEPLVSEFTTAELRRGDGNAIFFKTLREVDARLKFGQDKQDSFPILLVLSEINWRPLDDFYRLHPEGDALVFEGNLNRGQHFPGATSGGSRATYLARRGVGWGLVSADGWRVPYRGTDCVIYHEGCGHTVGLPHPEPGNGSVMSMGQYRGWLSESWLDKEQKLKMAWDPAIAEQETEADPNLELYTHFRALPQTMVPAPDDEVRLKLDWPEDAKVKTLRVRYQTAIDGPWIEVPQSWNGDAPQLATLGRFDRPTPLSYRVDAELENGAATELWGYLQVRSDPNTSPLPLTRSIDLLTAATRGGDERRLAELPSEEIDLLAGIDLDKQWKHHDWVQVDGKLQSPKNYGARLELSDTPQPPYRLTAIIEPLDEPNGLLFGHCVGSSRFVTLFNYRNGEQNLSAIENVDGQNVGNDTTFRGQLFKPNQLSQVIVEVTAGSVEAFVDGRRILYWKGNPDRLSLGDYWKTPNPKALFLGAYDCRYRFHRLTLESLSER